LEFFINYQGSGVVVLVGQGVYVSWMGVSVNEMEGVIDGVIEGGVESVTENVLVGWSSCWSELVDWIVSVVIVDGVDVSLIGVRET
jgi:hypothetical protein